MAAAGNFLSQAIVYLGAAVVVVPVAKKLGLGSVLGYLIAGILIGPFVLGFVGQEGKDIMHFAEFGVVIMLFLIGLELEPASFWRMRRRILGLGTFQFAGTAGAIFAAAFFYGFVWQAALAISLAFAMSSTAIALQSMKEKGLMQTSAGKSSFAVLLFQDIAVIPILAILPLIAFMPVANSGDATFISRMPGWLQTVVLVGAVAGVILAGKFLVVPLLRMVARTRLREIFVASALLIVVSIAFLMQAVGLSPALGTFLAGVILANSEYRHELESDLEPFKGLLLGLFFLAVGASINFDLVFGNPTEILLLVAFVMLAKAVVLYFAARTFKLSFDQNMLLTFSLSQIGEFAFVILTFSYQLRILSDEWNDKMMAVTALSMTVTPLLLLLNERLIAPRFGTPEAEETHDEIEEKHPVIIAGFGHFGSTVGRFLRANGINATYLDNDSDQVDLLRKMGFKVYYGDATRYDLLKAAGADEAKILICALNSTDATHALVETARKYFPHLEIMARTKNRYDAYDLLDIGVENVYRETIDTSVRLGVDALKKLGYRSYTAFRQGQNFIRYDERALRKLMPHHKDLTKYITVSKEEMKLQEDLLASERYNIPNTKDHLWDSEILRENAVKSADS
jgi:CPA2 family monovalent cation:H+ antiporter-2